MVKNILKDILCVLLMWGFMFVGYGNTSKSFCVGAISGIFFSLGLDIYFELKKLNK